MKQNHRVEKGFNFKVKFQLEVVPVGFKGGLMWPHLCAELKQQEARNRGQKVLQKEKKKIVTVQGVQTQKIICLLSA